MGTKKQTAVEWLVDQLTHSISLQQKHIDDLKEQAKKMEKQQIIDTFGDSRILSITNNCNSGEQYYKETYGEI